MKIISATEFKQNLGLYLDIAQVEDIIVERNGKRSIEVLGIRSQQERAFEEMENTPPIDVPENWRDEYYADRYARCSC